MFFSKRLAFLSPFLTILMFPKFGVSELAFSNIIDYTVRQYAILAERVSGSENFIRTGNPLSPTWNMKNVGDWTVGFHGGSMWMLYKLTADDYWKNLALEYQERVKERQFDTGTHDVGYIIMSTFGLALQYAQYNESIPIIIQAAESLSTRFVPIAGVIRSWNGPLGEVTVIAENVMNLELLLMASKLSGGNSNLTDIVVSHYLKTIENHFRPDGSVFHVVGYSEANGNVLRKYNTQGYADDSTWSRGLAWVIHGYTTIYESPEVDYKLRKTFLEYAEKAANYFITNLPDDFVPYYDFDAPYETEYVPRDTAAAAIASHAFLKLFKITRNQTYFSTAESIMKSLISDKYRADGNPAYKVPAIMVNGTVFFSRNDFNTAIVYGDFYFLRALDLYMDINASKKFDLFDCFSFCMIG